MCIRDSFGAAFVVMALEHRAHHVQMAEHITQTARQRLFELQASTQRAQRHIGPVSYTHLDVYKRQVLSSCTFILILIAQPIYGALVSRFPRRVFLPVLFGFFIACLLAFHFLFDTQVAGRGMVFFLWVTVFNVFSVAMFWSFMADVFSNAEARKYYGYIGAAGTIGAFTGPLITRALAEQVGLANLMLVSAAFLAACLVCIWRLRQWALLREVKVGRDNESAMGGDCLLYTSRCV